MDRHFKIKANEDGCNEEIILKESNLLYAVTEVNMNADFITKVVECDERGQELNTGVGQLTIPDVSNRRELLIAYGEWIHELAGCKDKEKATTLADSYLSNL